MSQELLSLRRRVQTRCQTFDGAESAAAALPARRRCAPDRLNKVAMDPVCKASKWFVEVHSKIQSCSHANNGGGGGCPKNAALNGGVRMQAPAGQAPQLLMQGAHRCWCRSWGCSGRCCCQILQSHSGTPQPQRPVATQRRRGQWLRVPLPLPPCKRRQQARRGPLPRWAGGLRGASGWAGSTCAPAAEARAAVAA